MSRYGTCAACGDRIRVEDEHGVLYLGLVARCHGSTERHVIDELALQSHRPESVFKPIHVWMKNLFAADCNPDVRELLRYNREARAT